MRILEKPRSLSVAETISLTKIASTALSKRFRPSYDMYSMDDEKFYAEEYWQLIKASFEKNKVPADRG
jgi:hypothetical protein